MIKKLNPLYFLGTSVFFALIFFVSASLSKSELTSVNKENMALKKEIDGILGLKKEYGDAKRKKRDFQRITDNRLIKPFIKTNTVTATKATFHAQGAGAKETKWFLQKLFNENFRLKSLDLTKSDEGMEIKTEVLF